MHFTTTTNIPLLIASAALAAPTLNTRQTPPLAPWQLASLYGFSPSGRPGESPWIYITATLTDPNELVLGTSDADNSAVTLPAGNQALNCRATWIRGETPFGRSWPCEDNDGEAYGWWTMRVVDAGDGASISSYTLVFTRVAEKLYLGSSYRRTFEATQHFEVGNQLSGSCGASGVCGWGLKAELAPFAIQQTETTAAAPA